MSLGIVRSCLSGLALVVAFVASPLGAQGTGRLLGRVVTTEGGIPIAGATVTIVGTAQKVTTSMDGRFTFIGVTPGLVDLRAMMIGFGPKVVTGIVVAADSTTRQDISLAGATVTLSELTVSAEVERGTVNAAIDLQRNATGIVSATSSEQIARSPDGDAGAALQRVSGASISDGRPSVRGLGDRFTTAVLNGARMISSEPEKKTIDLGLIPSSLLETIEVSKTATADQEGDFAGATIRIQTKDVVDRPFFTLSASSGFNDAVTGQRVVGSPSVSGDLFAAGASRRALPGPLAAADLSSPQSPAQFNQLVGGLRNVWSARERTGAPNASLGFTAGGTMPPRAGGVSYLLSGSWSRSEEIRAGQRRAVASPTGDGINEQDRFSGTTGRQGVLWGGIANFGVDLSPSTRLSLHNTYTRSMDNEARQEQGLSENLGLQLDVTRLRYVERSVLSDRLALRQQLTPRQTLDLNLTYGAVRRQEPDRSEMVYVHPTGTPGTAEWLGFSNEAAVRTFGDLKEHAVEAGATWQLRLGQGTDPRQLKFGALYRETRRDADNRSYSIALTRPLPADGRARTPEDIFGGSYSGPDDSYFRIVPLFAGGAYSATDRLTAAYAQTTLPVGTQFEMTAGMRVERSAVRVSSLSTALEASEADPTFTDFLPSLAVTWHARPNVNIRFSAARTLARPEYRELSPILAREVIGGDNIKGDPTLKRSLIENYDLRWEHYPRPGELMSVAVFAKKFHDPMERVYLATSGTRLITTVNALGATDYGVELELRKQLAGESGFLSHFAVAGNVTVMKSTIHLDPDRSALSTSDRRMVGQAPYLVNASLTWTSTSGRSSMTLLFNRIGDRLTEAGEKPLPDVNEAPRSLLDAALRFPLTGGVTVKVNGQNLLDAPIRITQGPVTREYSRTGRVMAVGFSWTR